MRKPVVFERFEKDVLTERGLFKVWFALLALPGNSYQAIVNASIVPAVAETRAGKKVFQIELIGHFSEICPWLGTEAASELGAPMIRPKLGPLRYWINETVVKKVIEFGKRPQPAITVAAAPSKTAIVNSGHQMKI